MISRRRCKKRSYHGENGTYARQELVSDVEAFEDHKKECHWQVGTLQFCTWQQVMVWCGWLDRQQCQGGIKESAVFSVRVQLDLHVLELQLLNEQFNIYLCCVCCLWHSGFHLASHVPTHNFLYQLLSPVPKTCRCCSIITAIKSICLEVITKWDWTQHFQEPVDLNCI